MSCHLIMLLCFHFSLSPLLSLSWFFKIWITCSVVLEYTWHYMTWDSNLKNRRVLFFFFSEEKEHIWIHLAWDKILLSFLEGKLSSLSFSHTQLYIHQSLSNYYHFYNCVLIYYFNILFTFLIIIYYFTSLKLALKTCCK